MKVSGENRSVAIGNRAPRFLTVAVLSGFPRRPDKRARWRIADSSTAVIYLPLRPIKEARGGPRLAGVSASGSFGSFAARSAVIRVWVSSGFVDALYKTRQFISRGETTNENDYPKSRSL